MLTEQELYQYVQLFVCLIPRQLWILICFSPSSPPPLPQAATEKYISRGVGNCVKIKIEREIFIFLFVQER